MKCHTVLENNILSHLKYQNNCTLHLIVLVCEMLKMSFSMKMQHFFESILYELILYVLVVYWNSWHRNYNIVSELYHIQWLIRGYRREYVN